MFDPQSQKELHQEIARSLLADRDVLDALRAEIRPLRHEEQGILLLTPKRCNQKATNPEG